MGRIPTQDVVGMKVRCYANLTQSVVSVVAKEGTYKGFVVAHTSLIYLRDCHFVVNMAGNRRVRTEKKKYVHAYVHGTVLMVGSHTYSETELRVNFERLYYNPYRHVAFVTATEKAIIGAEEVVVTREDGRFVVYAKGVY